MGSCNDEGGDTNPFAVIDQYHDHYIILVFLHLFQSFRVFFIPIMGFGVMFLIDGISVSNPIFVVGFKFEINGIQVWLFINGFIALFFF